MPRSPSCTPGAGRDDVEAGETELRVAIFGATGLVGAGVVQAWLADPRVRVVRAVTRRPLSRTDPKLATVHCEDFLDLAPIAASLGGLDAACFCLGISASQAASQDEYRRITYGFALAAGRAVRAASPEAIFHFVSGAGTSEKSWMRWARVKAETERDLGSLGLAGQLSWRPAMVFAAAPPDRRTRMQEIGGVLTRLLRPLPSLAVDNTAIGAAMLQATLERRREGVIENREIRELAARYRAPRA
jgi:uncharacterized protein YbjT (DUF2867 family)